MVLLNYNNKSSRSSFSSDCELTILNKLKHLNKRQKMITNFHELVNSHPPILLNQNDSSIEQNSSKRLQITLCIYNDNLLRNNHQIKLDKFNKKIIFFNHKINNNIKSKPYLSCSYDHLALDGSFSRTQSSHSIIESNNIIENILNIGNDYCLFSYGQNRNGMPKNYYILLF
jgi:hypothetical protein